MKEPRCAHPSPLDKDDVIGNNQCQCLPKAELNTKNSTKKQLCCRLVEFLVFNSIHWKKGDVFYIGDHVEYDVICRWPLRKYLVIVFCFKRPTFSCILSWKGL